MDQIKQFILDNHIQMVKDKDPLLRLFVKCCGEIL